LHRPCAPRDRRPRARRGAEALSPPRRVLAPSPPVLSRTFSFISVSQAAPMSLPMNHIARMSSRSPWRCCFREATQADALLIDLAFCPRPGLLFACPGTRAACCRSRRARPSPLQCERRSRSPSSRGRPCTRTCRRSTRKFLRRPARSSSQRRPSAPVGRGGARAEADHTTPFPTPSQTRIECSHVAV
jgi:hypothetical protein